MSEQWPRAGRPDERQDIGEQLDDMHAERQAREAERQAREAERQAREAVESMLLDLCGTCPAPFQSWLRDVVCGNQGPDGRAETADFLGDVRRLGLVRAVLCNIDHDDSTAKDRRRGWPSNNLPNDRITFDVIRHALEHEEDPDWRFLAVKWLPQYAPDQQTAVELLAGRLRAGCGRKFTWLRCTWLAWLPRRRA